jgi:filamentous hemagglutinin
MLLSGLLGLQPALVRAQQIIPDGGAPAGNQPTVTTAPNKNVPLVDIVAPNSMGLSHNKYNAFNVDKQGAILNNFKGEAGGPSILGGILPGNPNLRSSSPASVILNEVTSGSRSAFNGHVEIFGAKADLIIANPNGITCDGCGFLNTPRMTLTTGKPDINSDGRLGGFTVDGGDITFSGGDANFAAGEGKVDLFDVVSRTVQVNGKIYGKDLRLTAGRNKFSYATRDAAALTAISGSPEFAIDGSALGSMQADTIRLVVTEKGAGVRMRGDMAASAGELSLSADGKISVGNISGIAGVTMRSPSSVAAKSIKSKKRVLVQADKGITLDTVVAGDEEMVLDGGQGLLSITGEAASLHNITLSAAAGVSAKALNAGRDLLVTSTSGNVEVGTLAESGNSLTIDAAGSISAVSLISTNSMNLKAARKIAVAGAAHATGNLAVTAASIAANSILSDAGEVSLVATTGSVNVRTLLSAAGDLSLTVSRIDAQDVRGQKAITIRGAVAVGGQILGGGNVAISGSGISAGLIASGVDFAKTFDPRKAAPSIDLAKSGNLTLNVVSGAIDTATLVSAGALNITAASLTGNAITAHQDIAINANTNIKGELRGGHDIGITGSGIKAGSIISGIDFAATERSGKVVLGTAGDLTLVATSGDIDAGRLLSAGRSSATAAQNIAANAVSQQTLSLSAGKAIVLTGEALSGSATSLKAASIAIDKLISGYDFAASRNNLVVSEAGSTTLEAAAGSITADSLTSGGDLTARALLNLTYNSMQSHGAVSLAAEQGVISVDGRTVAQGDISLTAKSIDFSDNRSNVKTSRMLFIDAANVKLDHSALTFGGLTLSGVDNLDLSDTVLSAITTEGGPGNIVLKAATIITTAATAVLAQNDLVVTLASLQNRGQFAAGNDLTFNIAGDFTNMSDGLVYSGRDMKLLVPGDIVNDQGAILAGRDLKIAANDTDSKNRSVTNLSGTIRAEHNAGIFTEKLTNRRLTAPKWERVLASDNAISKFVINPETWGKPVGILFDNPNYKPLRPFYRGEPQLGTAEWAHKLYGIITFSDGTSFRTRGNMAPDREMPWIWKKSFDDDDEMLAWLRSKLPKDQRGNLVVNANGPAKVLLRHERTAQFAWSFQWDDNTQLRQTIHEDRLTDDGGPQAIIQTGGNLTVDATELNNEYSSIESGGNATFAGTTLSNLGVALHRTTLTKCEAKGGCEAYDAAGNRNVLNDLGEGASKLTRDEIINAQPGTIKAAGELRTTFDTVNNAIPENMASGAAKLAERVDPREPVSSLKDLTAGVALFTPNPALASLDAGANPAAPLSPTAVAAFLDKLSAISPKPQSGGFGGTIPGQVFLYETRAVFLDVGKFYGSSYFMNRIGYKPERSFPFLGDAYFENQLIGQQMRRLVGQGLGKGSFIPGSDAIEQMKTLLDNGLAYAQAHNLRIGEQLSPDQVAALTQSVVIYVKQKIKGVEVLAPVVYLANSDKANLTVAGALISGGSLDMNVGDFHNSGVIAAKTNLKLVTTNIKADGGSFIAGDNADISASGSMTLKARSLNIAGTNVVHPNGGVQTGGNLTLHANDNLVVQGAAITAGGNAALRGKNITLDVVKVDNRGSQYATGAKVETGGSLSIAAGNNVNVIGSSAKAGTSLDVSAASGSVSVVTADVTHKIGNRNSTWQQQSELLSGAGTKIAAANDILLSGTKLRSGGDVALKAGDDINITAAQNRSATKFAGNSSSSVSHTGSEIVAGGGITAHAGNEPNDGDHDLGIIGSKLAAGGKVDLGASSDVTIAEAKDSSVVDTQTSRKRLFSSSKTSTHTETSTAIGSSISGGTIEINSGGGTTVSASKLKAGNDNGKGDLNITTGGDLVIASGKDKIERHDKSSGTGFLTRKSASLDSYDERTVASELGAAGNVTLNAGKNAIVSGSQVNAGETIHVEGDSVSVIGAEEDHALQTQAKKSGLFAGSGDGFYSLWGKAQKDNKSTSTLNAGSSLSAGKDVTISARSGDINVIGSNVDAKNDIVLDATRDVNILPGAESMTEEEREKRSGLGVQLSTGSGSASIGIGYGAATDNTRQGSNTNAVSTLSAGRDLKITAGRDLNSQGGQLSAEHDIKPVAGRDINLLSVQDTSNYEEMHEKLFAGATLSVSSSLVSTGNNISGAAKKLADVSDGYSAANAAFASLKAYDALDNIAKGGNLASVSLTAGFSFDQQQSQGETSTPIPTTLRAGHMIDFDAGRNLIGKGVQMNAGVDAAGRDISDPADENSGKIKFKAGHDLRLESTQATHSSSSSNKSAGANLGVSAGVGITAPNMGLTAGVNFSTGSSNTNGATQLDAHVSAKHVEFDVGNDTTLRGAVVSADDVKPRIGGDLTIISVPDTGSSKNKSASFDMQSSGSLDLGSPLSGSLPGVGDQLSNLSPSSLKPSGGHGLGTTNWITEQSGLVSKHRMDVEVKGDTLIDAGKVVSDDGDLRLKTATLTHKDFEGERRFEGGRVDLSIDVTGRANAPDPDNPARNHVLEGGFKVDDTRQSVRATVGPGEIEITDPQKQAKLEEADTTTPLSELNRDPDAAMEITSDKHIDLEVYLSSESVKAALKAGAAVTEIIGGVLEHVREPALAKAIRSKDIDPADALRQLQSGTCGEQRGDTFFLWEWIVPSAHAADCIIKTIKGDAIVIHDRAGCIEALGKALYNQVAGVPLNGDKFTKGLIKGAGEQGEEFIALVSNPSGLMKTMSGVAFEFYQDPKAAALKYGVETAAGLQEKSLLYVKALANGDYEAAGNALSGLAVDLVIKVATPVPGAGLAAIKAADKIAALKKIEAVEKAARLDATHRPKLTIRDYYKHHKAFVDDLVAQLENLGYKVEIDPMFKHSCGTNYCKPDIIYKTPSGKVSIIEIKTGNADLTFRQSKIFPQIRNGDSIPWGKVAAQLGLDPGVPLKDQGYPNGIPIYEQPYPGLL